jgi:hypothetical protein
VVKVVAFDAEIRVWSEVNSEVKVAGWTLAKASAAMSWETESLSLADAWGDFELKMFDLRNLAGSMAGGAITLG